MSRYWLPDLKTDFGRLFYIGLMNIKANTCISESDPNFTTADIHYIEELWRVNVDSMDYGEAFRVVYELMHAGASGGNSIENNTCSIAKSWFVEDRYKLWPARGVGQPP